MSEGSPARHVSHVAVYNGNDHNGQGLQHNGLGINNTHHQRDVNLWFNEHRGQVLTTIAVVAIVAMVSLGLGLGLGLKPSSNPPTGSDHATSPGPAGPGLPSSTTAQGIPSQTETIPSVTKPASPYECRFSCDQSYQDEHGCHPNCPGAPCSDDTGCQDPYPCIPRITSGTTKTSDGLVLSSCCNTGCKETWTCYGACSLDLKCVTATNFTAASTCTKMG
ncbi:uncharacterized protein PG986_008547 [Apiospora aurea]|uniref:Uncharacterized protein n=1 Tax=Apiospora aurea TaxID=335848 RepID=A0ABR1QFR2_9PEZI